MKPLWYSPFSYSFQHSLSSSHYLASPGVIWTGHGSVYRKLAELFAQVAEFAAEKNLPIFIHVGNYREVVALIDYSKRYPITKFIVGHLSGLELYLQSKRKGEKLWLSKRSELPEHYDVIQKWLIILGLVGMILIAWGLYQLHLWISILGAVVLILAQLWRMIVLVHCMSYMLIGAINRKRHGVGCVLSICSRGPIVALTKILI